MTLIQVIQIQNKEDEKPIKCILQYQSTKCYSPLTILAVIFRFKKIVRFTQTCTTSQHENFVACLVSLRRMSFK